MSFWVLPLHYLYWHYVLAWRDIFQIYKNFLWFWWHFFSIGILLRTFFSPWKRLGEEYRSGFRPQAALETFAVNTMMRFVGVVCRSVLLALGFLVLVVTALLGPVVVIVWLGIPLWWVMLLWRGLMFLLG